MEGLRRAPKIVHGNIFIRYVYFDIQEFERIYIEKLVFPFDQWFSKLSQDANSSVKER